MRLAIYGPGGFGRELLTAARPADGVLFISDDPREIGSVIEGAPVHALADLVEDELSKAAKPDRQLSVVIAVADSGVRRKLASRVSDAGLLAGRLIAPTAILGVGVSLGEGAIVCDFAMITASARVGRHFQANIYAYVAHDCRVGDFVTLAPKACVNGNVVLEDDVYVGTGALIRQGAPGRPLVIGKGATIGMGAVVTRDVPPGTIVVGNPARPMAERSA